MNPFSREKERYENLKVDIKLIKKNYSKDKNFIIKFENDALKINLTTEK